MTVNMTPFSPDQPLPVGSQRIAVIGECMIELHGEPPHLTQGFAGDTLNTAVYLARLTEPDPVKVSYITAIGTDPFSDRMLDFWGHEGIDCSNVLRLADRNPGLYIVSVDDNGERSFTYWRGESAAKAMFSCTGAEDNLSALREFDWIYLSGITLAILPDESRSKLFHSLQLAKNGGSRIVFDNNYRPRLWPDAATARRFYDELLPLCDIALLTLDDEQLLCPQWTQEQIIAHSRTLGVPELVIKRGAEPCLIYTDMGETQVAAEKVAKVVDTTAAGDSFSAGYLAARVHGLSVEAAARQGHALASRVIQFPGALIDRQCMPAEFLRSFQD